MSLLCASYVWGKKKRKKCGNKQIREDELQGFFSTSMFFRGLPVYYLSGNTRSAELKLPM